MKVFNLLCKIVCVVSVTISTLLTQAHAANNSDTCDLYPLTLPYSLVSGAKNGDSFDKLAFGSQDSTHGWLTWSGDLNDSTAATSLLPPGDDSNYINPNDGNDSIININDWVFGLSSIPAVNSVSSSLNSIMGTDIHIPLWSQTATQSGKLIYQVQEFGVINISAFKLKGRSSLSFTYKGLSACTSQGNTRPIASAQSLSTSQDTALPVTLSGSDTDGDTLSFSIVSNPTNGALSGNGANQTYTPNNGFSGPDLFTFKANDGTEDSTIATVAIDVTAVTNTAPIANNANVSTSQDTALPVTLSGSDTDGDTLSFSVVSNPTNGALSGNGANQTYTPSIGSLGPDSFTFKVNDGTEDSTIATINITVNTTGNNAPVAYDQKRIIPVSDSRTFIQLNGRDLDGEELTYTIVTYPSNGDADSFTNGKVPYTANPGFEGYDFFTYKVSDGVDESNIAKVHIYSRPLNETSKCELYPFTLPQSKINSSSIGDVFSSLTVGNSSNNYNWLSWNGGNSTYYIENMFTVPGNSYGYVHPLDLHNTYLETGDTVLGLGDAIPFRNYPDLKSIVGLEMIIPIWETYTPYEENSYGQVIQRGLYDISSFARVKVTEYSTKGKGYISFEYKGLVNCDNAVPELITQTWQTNEDEVVLLIPEGLDQDGDPVNIFVTQQPENGSITEAPSGWIYSPAANYNGTDTFKYLLTDSSEISDEFTASITILPVVDLPKLVSPPLAQGFISNEYYHFLPTIDPDGGDLTYKLLIFPNGMTIDASGLINWTPALSDEGEILVEIQVTNNAGLSTLVSYTITVTHADTDNDGIIDSIDICPGTFSSETPDVNGCSNIQLEYSSVHKMSNIPQTNADVIYQAYDDAHYRWGSKKSYTRIDSDEIVVDIKNDLRWQDNSDAKNLKLSWYDAEAYCESLDMGGKTDWRLPSNFELMFLLNLSQSRGANEAKISDVFINADAARYWGDDVREITLVGEMIVHIASLVDFDRSELFKNHHKDFFESSSSSHNVRCVSGDKAFIPELSALNIVSYIQGEQSSESVALDVNNNIAWQYRNINNIPLLSWDSYMQYCENSTFAQASDWRLPNIFELQTIVRNSLFNMKSKYPYGYKFWSSSYAPPSDIRSAPKLLKMHITDEGYANQEFNSVEEAHVLCVRDYVTPIAVATSNVTTALFSEVVSFDASTSSSEDGAVTEYLWENLSHELYGQSYIENGEWNYYGKISTQSTFSTDEFVLGVNNIKLTVKNQAGIPASTELTINVDSNPNDPAPFANAGDDKIIESIYSFVLDASRSTDNLEIVKYEWYEDDVIFSNQVNIRLVHRPVGTYTFTLKVYDANGGIDTDTVVVQSAIDMPPVAVAGENQTVRFGMPIILDASGSSDEFGIRSYYWHSEDPFYFNSNEMIVSKSDFTEGTHNITLEVEDTNGVKSIGQVVITVLPAYALQQCNIVPSVTDSSYVDSYPIANIPMDGSFDLYLTDQIELAFNAARAKDDTVHKYLKMPTQAVWGSWSSQQKGLYLINSEREARGLKPFEGVSAEIVNVATQYAEHILSNNEVITHTRSSDGANALDRLNENANISNNQDIIAKHESLASFETNYYPSINQSIVNAIYNWIYADSSPVTGETSWANREHIFQTSYNENSGISPYKEGLIGLGFSSGGYDPDLVSSVYKGAVVALNTIDPTQIWDYLSIETVDTSDAHNCHDELALTFAPETPTTGLDSLSISPSNIIIKPNESITLNVMGGYSDSSTQDLTSYVQFEPDGRSVIEVNAGIVTGRVVGKSTLSASVNSIGSNLITIYVTNNIVAPLANAGSDQTIKEGKVLTLDGSASTDDVAVVSYEWTLDGQLVGSESTLVKSNLAAGIWMFQLKVTDGISLSATDTVTVTVEQGIPPIANAGSDQTIRVGTLVNFDASASTDDIGIASYEWTLNSNVLSTLSSFTYNDFLEGHWTVELSVTDDDGLTSTDTINVIVLAKNTLQACNAVNIEDDIIFEDTFPEANIAWIGTNSTGVIEIEKAFNHARFTDKSVYKYLKMPSQLVWDYWSIQQQGLYIINSERAARGIKPYTGISNEVVDVVSQYADYLRLNNEVITHYRSSDGASQTDRLNENATIANNTDNISLEESIFSHQIAYTSQSAAVINAIYVWIYQDINPLFGYAWGHRAHILQTGLYENSGTSSFTEGLLGFGISMGDYNPENNDPSAQGVIVVFNTIDPSSTWDYTNTITVDTSVANQCNSELALAIDDQAAPVAGLQSILITPDNMALNPYDSETLQVTGIYSNGSSQDLTAFANFVADERSIVSIDSGIVTALNSGVANISANVNGVVSNSVEIYVAAESDTSNLTGTYAEQYLQYLPTNASVSSYNPKAFSLFNGLVTDRNGTPLNDVIISIHNQPEFGSVTTDINGRFILPAEAGERTLVYSKEGYLTIHRSIVSASNSWATLDDVMLLNLDSKKTFIDLSSPTAQVHRSTIITDGSGERATTLVFNGINSVTVTDKSGNSRQLTDFFVQATEYETPSSMPADLPEESAFTYCSELQISGVGDEEQVVFDNMVVMYVDNFLNFAVGEIVPIGYYDRTKELWKSSENGVVVKLLDTSGDGNVDGLDYTGDDIADDINGDGNTTDEVAGIEIYVPGSIYWRGRFNHFTPVDYNWPSNSDASKPSIPKTDTSPESSDDDENVCVSSYIKPKSLTLHEDIAVTGTRLTLHYSSRRTHGYHHKISANVSDETIPDSVTDMIAVLEIAGNRFEQSFTPTTYQDVEFEWDGKSPTGDIVSGIVRGRISIGYKYSSEYFSAGNVATSGQALSSFPTAWAQLGSASTAVTGREDIIRWSNAVVTVLNAPESQIANGWSLSNHHISSPFNMVYRGDGEAVDVNNNTNILKTNVVQSQHPGDDGFYQKGGLSVEYSIDEMGILTDKVTNLQWQYHTGNLPRFVTKSQARNYCTSLALGDSGQIWRLPTYKEHLYFVDKSGAAHDYPIYSYEALTLWNDNSLETNNRLQAVACVSGETLDKAYQKELKRNDADEVVIDESNGLMWQDSADNDSIKLTWSESIDHCESLDHSGFTDWRLPNINELMYTLPNSVFVNRAVIYPTGNWSPLASFVNPYWASTSNPEFAAIEAWAIESMGYSSPYFAKDAAYNVRCVRDDLTRSPSPYVFDHNGKHIKTLDMASGITLTTFAYNAKGQLSTIKDQFDNTVTITRNAEGVATEIVSPDGYITKLTVDENSNLIRAEYDDSSAYDFVYQNALMIEETDTSNNLFTRSFDSSGRILQSEDPEGGQWSFYSTKDALTKTLSYGYSTVENTSFESQLSYLLNGDKRLFTTELDNTEHEQITQADKLKETVNVAGAIIVVDKVIDSKTKLEIPQLITTILPSGLKNIVQLDKTYAENGTDTSKTTHMVTNNTKVSRVYSDTQTGTQTNTSPESRSVSYQYDPLTKQLTNATVNGLEVSSYQYDIRGRLALVTSGDRVTRYNYNDLVSKGGLTSITDAGQQTTAFEYDLMGRMNKITYHDGRILEQSYDNNGNLASLTPPGQPAHYFNYDSVDKETDYTPPDVTGVVDPSTRYDYDRDRKLTTITRPDSQQLHFNYSAGTNQLASMDIPHGRYSYTYNTHGVITAINAPDDGSLTFTYDASLPLSQTWSGVVAGSVSQSYNTDFIVTQQCINAANCIDYQYDLDGLLTNAGTLAISREAQKDGLINGTTLQNINMTRGYNLHGEMDTETTQYNTTSLQSATYLRDKLGRITQRSLTLQGAKSTDDYSYDQAGRLATVINGALTTSYIFDDNGNRLSKSINDATTTTTTTVNGIYDAQDRLTSYGNCAYQYSANGELQQKTCTVGEVIETTAYIYDVLGNLLQVTLTDAAKIDYIIDGQNRRIGKKVGDTLVQGFLYGDQLNPVAELDASNNIVSKFVYGTKVNVPDYMIKGGVTYQIISDHLGSPRLVVNASTGVVAQRMDYDEFGIITNDTNPGFQPFGFAGGLYEQQTGLTRFGARDYDAITGRWTSKDPIRFAGGDSNIYGYVFSDPVNFIDPNGKFAVFIWYGAVNAVISATATCASGDCSLKSVAKSAVPGFFIGTLSSIGLGIKMLSPLSKAASDKIGSIGGFSTILGGLISSGATGLSSVQAAEVNHDNIDRISVESDIKVLDKKYCGD